MNLKNPFIVYPGDKGTPHDAHAWQAPNGKWAWYCTDCRRWSRGFRYETQGTAQKGADKHNKEWGPSDGP